MGGASPSQKSWAPKPGEVIDSRYRLESVVDSGGMGMVMRAQHLRMRRPVAVKLLHPDIARQDGYRARFEREVELATKIVHPNVVQCFDFGETENGVLFLVMELLEGRSLKDELWQNGRMSTSRTVAIAGQLLDGMAAAHMADVVHRDLKPGNVWIAADHRDRDVVKILDFGLAKSLTSNDVRLTQTGAICGTAAYLAPEALVRNDTTKAADVYALGLILLEMLQGRKVFTGRGLSQTFLQQLVVPARIPRRIWDTGLGSLIGRALQKHPADRPADADQLYKMLTSVSDSIPDFRLNREEIPPPPSNDLPSSLLNDLADGKYRNLDTLRSLPSPEPYDSATPVPDDKKTQRIVMEKIRSSAENQVLGPETPRYPDREKPTVPIPKPAESKPAIASGHAAAVEEVPPDVETRQSLTTPLAILAVLLGVAGGLAYTVYAVFSDDEPVKAEESPVAQPSARSAPSDNLAKQGPGAVAPNEAENSTEKAARDVVPKPSATAGTPSEQPSPGEADAHGRVETVETSAEPSALDREPAGPTRPSRTPTPKPTATADEESDWVEVIPTRDEKQEAPSKWASPEDEEPASWDSNLRISE